MARKRVSAENKTVKNRESHREGGMDPECMEVPLIAGQNPQGGPPIAGSRGVSVENLAALARLHGPLCLDALADEARSGSGASRVSAAKVILEHGFGKAGKGAAAADDGALPGLPPLPDTLRGLLERLYGPLDAAAENPAAVPAESTESEGSEDA